MDNEVFALVGQPCRCPNGASSVAPFVSFVNSVRPDLFGPGKCSIPTWILPNMTIHTKLATDSGGARCHDKTYVQTLAGRVQGMRPGITPCVIKPVATYAAATHRFQSPAASVGGSLSSK